MPESAKRERLHDASATPANRTTAIWTGIGIGDETTVRLLLYRLREDYRASQPPPLIDSQVFGLELIEAMAASEEHRARNAERLLGGVTSDVRQQWIATAASSDRPQLRRGAELALRRLDSRSR